jgi:hypothetical protein
MSATCIQIHHARQHVFTHVPSHSRINTHTSGLQYPSRAQRHAAVSGQDTPQTTRVPSLRLRAPLHLLHPSHTSCNNSQQLQQHASHTSCSNYCQRCDFSRSNRAGHSAENPPGRDWARKQAGKRCPGTYSNSNKVVCEMCVQEFYPVTSVCVCARVCVCFDLLCDIGLETFTYMCACLCVCTYIYVHVCTLAPRTNTNTNVHIHTHTHTRVHLCTSIYVHVCVHIHIRACVCISFPKEHESVSHKTQFVIIIYDKIHL